jgi:murein DD-endopeptidase MepM/ murein hydrolase activator NlpD
MAEGKVALSRHFHVPGNAVIIDHGNSIFSKYYHLSELSVKEGTSVLKGALIGKSGGTGRVEAPHLHWEITWRGIPMDPLSFLKLSKDICTQQLAYN